jgi:hypothetical protein
VRAFRLHSTIGMVVLSALLLELEKLFALKLNMTVNTIQTKFGSEDRVATTVHCGIRLVSTLNMLGLQVSFHWDDNEKCENK